MGNGRNEIRGQVGCNVGAVMLADVLGGQEEGCVQVYIEAVRGINSKDDLESMSEQVAERVSYVDRESSCATGGDVDGMAECDSGDVIEP